VSKRSEALRERTKKIVNHQFSGVTNLTEEAYKGSLEIIAEQVEETIKETGMVWLAEDQNFPRILVEPEWTAPEAVRQYRELLKKANFKRVEEETK